jgi:hypothetical protein
MNSFQLDILKKLMEYASPIELGDVSVSIEKGPNEVVVELKLISRGISFWVYDDGAQIRGPQLDIRYEAPDFDDAATLATKFLSEAKSYCTA